MSVILKTEADEYILYCKGADSVIMERMKPEKNPKLDDTNKDLSEFADEGLRTLLIAKRVITKEYYLEWLKKYKV